MILTLAAILWTVTALLASEPAPQSIRNVNWKNFAYPLSETDDVPGEVRWMVQGSSGTVSLLNGRYVVPNECSDDIRPCPSVTFDSVKYGALFGINTTIAAVVLTYHTGGTANWQYV